MISNYPVIASEDFCLSLFGFAPRMNPLSFPKTFLMQPQLQWLVSFLKMQIAKRITKHKGNTQISQLWQCSSCDSIHTESLLLFSLASVWLLGPLFHPPLCSYPKSPRKSMYENKLTIKKTLLFPRNPTHNSLFKEDSF